MDRRDLPILTLGSVPSRSNAKTRRRAIRSCAAVSGGHPAQGRARHAALGSHDGLDQGTALAVVQELLSRSDIRVTRGYPYVSSTLAAYGC